MSLAEDFFGTRDRVRTLVVAPYQRNEMGKHRFSEFVSLCEAADLNPVCVDTAPVREPHPGTYFRRGHLERLRDHVTNFQADIVAIDLDLTPVQQRNLEQEFGCAILDRSAIILIIFGRRASTRAGKLQVELAQFEYVLPRLVGLWQHFDREKGGIGMRGAGEKQIEIDRRLVQRTITKIKRQLKTVQRTRDLHRRKRRNADILHVAAIGYTNAGKSTLLQQLSHQSIFVRDMPFATLDPLTRRIELNDGRAFLLTDTVGFVRDLPHGLVEAFKSTLEESLEADVLLHVIDASAPDAQSQVETTEEVMQELGITDRPTLYVLNKLDLVRDPDSVDLLNQLQPQVRTALHRGEGLDGIVDWIRHQIRRRTRTVRIRVPLDEPEAVRRAEAVAVTPGSWGERAVEYDVPEDSDLARAWPA